MEVGGKWKSALSSRAHNLFPFQVEFNNQVGVTKITIHIVAHILYLSKT